MYTYILTFQNKILSSKIFYKSYNLILRIYDFNDKIIKNKRGKILWEEKEKIKN